jgi:drug/metabolite transporter (DMT)-like permease
MIIAFIAALLSGLEIIFARYGYKRFSIHSEHLVTLYFGCIAVIMFPGMFFITYTPEMFAWQNVLFLLALVLCAIVYNVCNFKGMKYSEVDNAEPLILMAWVFSIFFAFIIYPEERHVIDFVLAFISVASLFFTTKFTHLDKGSTYLLIGSFFVGVHSLFVKELVPVYGPYMLYFIRAVFIWILVYAMFRAPQSLLRRDILTYSSLFALLVIIQNVLLYTSYAKIGIVHTSLILTLAPVVALTAGALFLKEKLHLNKVISALVITVCIALSTIL